MAYISFDPWQQREYCSCPDTSRQELEGILKQAGEAWSLWRRKPVKERCDMLLTLENTLLSRREEYAGIMASEMGKPLRQGLAEIDKCALLCRYYAENAEEMLRPDKRKSSARESYVCYEPQGIILGIMPWNFPFWQVFRFVVPAFAGGNAALLKHASNVPGCALAIEKAVIDAGFPAGLFRSIFPSHSQVSELISSPLIRGVSLTGSNKAGAEIASVAGRHMKKVVMELGGSDPLIIFPDASLNEAVEAAVMSRFQNCGQSCIAAKRMIVHQEIYDEFRDMFVTRTKSLIVGNPFEDKTEIGPMVSSAAAGELEKQLRLTTGAGGKLLCGGRDESRGPAVFIPAVVDEVPLAAPLAIEEVFGPVAPLFSFRTTEEAVAMANDTPFGLGATVWTTDNKLALLVARDIDTGTVAVNGYVKSEPGLPFGGVKESGFGRELSLEGMREFLNIKTINIF